MNERIKELADIAYKNHLKNNPDSSIVRRADYNEKFAELIVKDVTNLLRQEWFNENNGKEEIDGFTRESSIRLGKKLAYEKSVDLIVNHFGVE